MKKIFLILLIVLFMGVFGIVIFNNLPIAVKKAINFPNYEYCSMENSCPTDKCNRVTLCGGGSDGCTMGSQECHYKDSVLKEKYFEYNVNEAKKCVLDYIEKNKNNKKKLEYIDLSKIEISETSDGCSSWSNINMGKDKYCWFFQIGTHPIPPKNSQYVVILYVGAQTCSVYPKESIDNF